MRFRDGHARRTRVKNLVSPLHYGEEGVEVTPGVHRAGAPGVAQPARQAERDRQVHRLYRRHAARRLATRASTAIAVAVEGARASRRARGAASAGPADRGGRERRPRRDVARSPRTTPRRAARSTAASRWSSGTTIRCRSCPTSRRSVRLMRATRSSRSLRPAGGSHRAAAARGRRSAVIPAGYTERLRSALDEVEDARTRACASSATPATSASIAAPRWSTATTSVCPRRARAARWKPSRRRWSSPPAQAEHEGHGFVQSDDVSNAGFTPGRGFLRRVQVVYDEPAVLDDYEGVDVTRLTRELAPKSPSASTPCTSRWTASPSTTRDRSSADVQRCTDVALDQADIHFRFDNLERAAAERRGDAGTVGSLVPATGADRGPGALPDVLELRRASSSAPRCASTRRDSPRRPRHWQVIALDATALPSGSRAERFPAPVRELQYVLRVYDAQGKFDETSPQPLWLVNESRAAQPDQARRSPPSSSSRSRPTHRLKRTQLPSRRRRATLGLAIRAPSRRPATARRTADRRRRDRHH